MILRYCEIHQCIVLYIGKLLLNLVLNFVGFKKEQNIGAVLFHG